MLHNGKLVVISLGDSDDHQAKVAALQAAGWVNAGNDPHSGSGVWAPKGTPTELLQSALDLQYALDVIGYWDCKGESVQVAGFTFGHVTETRGYIMYTDL